MGQTPNQVQEIAALRADVELLRRQLSDVQDVQAIQWLLNHYTALHDDACFDLAKRLEWENLFADDGIAVYPFGQHKGRAGKGSWAFTSVQYFERCQLLSSNFDISFSPDRKKAHVRTNCIAQWLKNKDIHHDHFDEGGFYNWILRKESDGKWYIEHVKLTIQWTSGEDPTGVGPSTHGTPRL
ncbi:uncharacterized protein A1O9_00753 [Exophiala aquamarina CBS 119918]|uniref:SnoaL-like domain-containing protein n=1 Tax=Exophiala aquamarina CBS 119918 TaxID=1182545 RepID=A0A072Q4H5_9EURO|nr:uncharacterized protein A1O9_00753 [Exophiala aquamarina CBS 119918]KEF62780.1 hypothetical protein A1O9_00753 [Exophiala aquamarina CBS 119918]